MNDRTKFSFARHGAFAAVLAVCGMTLVAPHPAQAGDADGPTLRGSIDLPVVRYENRPILQHSRLRNGFAHSGDEGADSVESALYLALGFDPVLRQTLADSHAARADLWIARLAFLPKVTASVSRSRGTDIVSSSRGNTRVDEEDVVSLDLTYPLFTSGARYHAVKRASAASKAADFDVLSKENDVMSDAAGSYLDLIASRRRKDALGRNIEAVRSIVEITRSKSRRGFADQSDLALARAQLALVEREYEKAVEAEEKANTEFKRVSGSMPASILREPSIDGIVTGTVEEAVARARSRNPRIQSARYSASAARYGVRESIGKYLPQVDLTGRYENAYTGPDQGESWNVGVKLTVPLIDPESLPTIRKKRYDSASAHYRSLDMERAMEKIIRDEWSAFHSAKKQLRHEEQRLSQLKRAALAARKKYRSGFAAIDDVLSRQLEVLDSEVVIAELKANKQASAYRIAIETSE